MEIEEAGQILQYQTVLVCPSGSTTKKKRMLGSTEKSSPRTKLFYCKEELVPLNNNPAQAQNNCNTRQTICARLASFTVKKSWLTTQEQHMNCILPPKDIFLQYETDLGLPIIRVYK